MSTPEEPRELSDVECPCGGIILANTDDCDTPLCDDCAAQIVAAMKPAIDHGLTPDITEPPPGWRWYEYEDGSTCTLHVTRDDGTQGIPLATAWDTAEREAFPFVAAERSRHEAREAELRGQLARLASDDESTIAELRGEVERLTGALRDAAKRAQGTRAEVMRSVHPDYAERAPIVDAFDALDAALAPVAPESPRCEYCDAPSIGPHVDASGERFIVCAEHRGTLQIATGLVESEPEDGWEPPVEVGRYGWPIKPATEPPSAAEEPPCVECGGNGWVPVPTGVEYMGAVEMGGESCPNGCERPTAPEAEPPPEEPTEQYIDVGPVYGPTTRIPSRRRTDEERHAASIVAAVAGAEPPDVPEPTDENAARYAFAIQQLIAERAALATIRGELEETRRERDAIAARCNDVYALAERLADKRTIAMAERDAERAARKEAERALDEARALLCNDGEDLLTVIRENEEETNRLIAALQKAERRAEELFAAAKLAQERENAIHDTLMAARAAADDIETRHRTKLVEAERQRDAVREEAAYAKKGRESRAIERDRYIEKWHEAERERDAAEAEVVRLREALEGASREAKRLHDLLVHNENTRSEFLDPAGPRAGIFREINAERARQDAKWGPVRRQPHVDPVLAARGADHFRICQEHEIPNVHRAKFLCQNAEAHGQCSFTAIAVEELAEVVEKHTDEPAMRVELVQLAAVIVKWIESLALPAPTQTTDPSETTP